MMDKGYSAQSMGGKRHNYPGIPTPPLNVENVSATEEPPLDIGWVFAVVKRRAWIMITVAILLAILSGGLVIFNTKKIKKEYQGSFKILAEPVTAEDRLANLLIQSQSSQFSADEVNKLSSSIQDGSMVDYQTLIRVLTSPKLMEPFIKKIQVKYPDINYMTVRDGLKINRVMYVKDGKEAGTKIMSFSYVDTDPAKILYVLKEASDYYLEYSRQERLKITRQSLAYIDSQLPSLQNRVEQIQQQLQVFRSQSQLNEPTITISGLNNQSVALQGQISGVQAQLSELRKLHQEITENLKKGKPLEVVLAGNPTLYQYLGNQLDTIESQIAINKAQFSEQSLPIQVLKEKKENLNKLLENKAKLIVNNVAAQIQVLEAREKSLLQSNREIDQKLQELPSQIRNFENLQRELQVAMDSFKLFISKRETLKLGQGQQNTPWTIIDPPSIDKDPKTGKLVSITQTNRGKNLAIAVILSTLSGIAVGFLVEILNTVFHTPDEIRWGTKLPVLGIVPLSKKMKKSPKRKTRHKKSPSHRSGKKLNEGLGSGPKMQGELDYFFLEAFRSFYTNLSLLDTSRSMRSLLITSAITGDGKSTVALHLAQTAASVGQRVLLVDADLRLPQLHERLDLPNLRGLSDAITQDLSLNDAIQRSPTEENLFVLTAGQPVSDPIKLLSSKKMQYLMEQFQAFFDLVIYDTPPLVGLADGHIISSRTDGTILVVAIDRTDRGLINKALEGLKISGAIVIGTVANEVQDLTHLSRQRPLGVNRVYKSPLDVLS